MKTFKVNIELQTDIETAAGLTSFLSETLHGHHAADHILNDFAEAEILIMGIDVLPSDAAETYEGSEI